MDCRCVVLASPPPVKGLPWGQRWTGFSSGSGPQVRLSPSRRRALVSLGGSQRVNKLWSPALSSAVYTEDLLETEACDEEDAIPPALPSAVELQSKFGCDGVRFLEVADLTVVELKLRNGATTRIVLPGAQITSYKPLMWHGGFEEILHTVLKRGEDDEVDSTPRICGGVGLLFSREDAPAGSLFSLTGQHRWQVDGVVCDPKSSAQVRFSCHRSWELSNPGDGALSFRYVVTLSQTSLSSALVVLNSGSVPVTFTGGIVNHIQVNTLEGVYATGLKGGRYQSHPFLAEQIKNPIWPLVWGLREEERTSHSWEVEESHDVKLQIGMNKLYSNLSDVALVDRGKRRMTIIRAMGFDDFQVSNAGTDSGKEFMQFEKNEFKEFICLGPARAYQPVVLSPGEEWKAAQMIEQN